MKEAKINRSNSGPTPGSLPKLKPSTKSNRLRILLIHAIDYPIGGASSAHTHLIIKGLRQNQADAALIIPHGESWGGMKNKQLQGRYDGVPFVFMSRSTDRSRHKLRRTQETLSTMRKTARFLRTRYKSGKLDAVILATPDFFKLLPVITTCLLGKIPFFIWSVERMSLNRDKQGPTAILRHISYLIAERILPRFAKGCIILSPYLSKYYLKYIRSSSLIISPNLVAPETISAAPRDAARENNLPDKSILVYSGSFAPKDGIPYLIEAFSLVANNRPDLNLVLLGKNDDPHVFSRLYRQIDSLGLRNRVEMPGYVSLEKLHSFYRKAKILLACRANIPFAHYSYAWKMGEYFLSERPVLASRVGSISEYFTDEKDIFLARPGDPKDIAEKITAILKDYPRALRIAAAGRETVIRDMHYIPQMAKFLEFISKQLNQSI